MDFQHQKLVGRETPSAESCDAPRDVRGEVVVEE